MSEDGPPPLEQIETYSTENHCDEPTTITIPTHLKHRLEQGKDASDCDTWEEYLEKLRTAHADPLTLNEAESVADYLEDRLDSAVKESVREALADSE